MRLRRYGKGSHRTTLRRPAATGYVFLLFAAGGIERGLPHPAVERIKSDASPFHPAMLLRIDSAALQAAPSRRVVPVRSAKKSSMEAISTSGVYRRRIAATCSRMRPAAWESPRRNMAPGQRRACPRSPDLGRGTPPAHPDKHPAHRRCRRRTAAPFPVRRRHRGPAGRQPTPGRRRTGRVRVRRSKGRRVPGHAAP